MAEFGLETAEMEKIKSAIASIDGIDKAVLYGSRAKGNYKPYSDIDISLFGDSLTMADLMRLYTTIEDQMLPYETDLNIFHTLKNENLKDHIRRCGVVIYDRSLLGMK